MARLSKLICAPVCHHTIQSVPRSLMSNVRHVARAFRVSMFRDQRGILQRKYQYFHQWEAPKAKLILPCFKKVSRRQQQQTFKWQAGYSRRQADTRTRAAGGDKTSAAMSRFPCHCERRQTECFTALPLPASCQQVDPNVVVISSSRRGRIIDSRSSLIYT